MQKHSVGIFFANAECLIFAEAERQNGEEMRRFIGVSVCVALIIVSIWQFSSAKKKTAPISVETIQTAERDVYNSIVSQGHITDAGVHRVIFAERSQITDVFIAPGQTVKRGDVLMKRRQTHGSFDRQLLQGWTDQFISAFSEYGINLNEKINIPTVNSNEIEVISPIDGVICGVNVQNNSTVDGLDVAATITDFSAMQVLVEVPELYIASIEPGQEVEISGDAFPNKKYKGFVSYIAPRANKRLSLTGNGETYVSVVVSLKNADAALKPGYTVSAQICTERREDTVTIPYDCIIQDDFGRELVYVVIDETIYKKRIMTGLELEQEVEVIYGLRPGETVICRPNDLRSGQAVTLKG